MPHCCHSSCHEESGVTREYVGEGELPKQRTQSEVAETLRCAGRGHICRDQGLWIQGVNVMVPQRQVFCVRASNLASDEGLGYQHTGAVYHRGKIPTIGELDCFSAHIRLRVPSKSEDKAEKGRKCKATDSRAMGLAAPWYRRGGTYVESSTPYSHGGRALVVKGAEEVENAEVNSKYHDKAEGQRPRNFIRPVLMGFSSNSRKWGG
ncbi:hypothetical protein BHM03_00017613 [Ensete ventricosum]|nr:hypothetical protein BHM03_00017613 [Ensete ventricosum]